MTQYQIRKFELKIKVIKQYKIYNLKILLIYNIISFLFPSIFNFFDIFKLYTEINIFNAK